MDDPLFASAGFRCIAFSVGNAHEGMEKGRNLGFKGEHFAAEGVLEADRPGMKGQALLAFCSFSVLPVAHNRVPDAGQMHPYLVLSARQQINLQQAQLFDCFSTL